MEIREEILRHTQEIETIIRKYLPEEKGLQKTVIQAMNYSFLSGGKRLRPMLMQETYRLMQGTSDIVEPFMAAIEMIHTYSLIHDDLPAMDNDDYRRGRKTTHVVFGEAMAILAGDGLLNLAFETASEALLREDAGRNTARALHILAVRSGIYGMAGGQSVDVENDGQPLSRETLDFINRLKTGALIEASMLIGAVLAGASDQECEIISRAASDFGLAFQIRDDILDVAGDEKTIGKPVGSDARNDKTTYVTIRGLEQSSEDVRQLSERALQTLDLLPYRNDYLSNLMRFLIYREK